MNLKKRNIFNKNDCNRKQKKIDTMKFFVMNKKFWGLCSVISLLPIVFLIILSLCTGVSFEWTLLVQGYFAAFFVLSFGILFISTFIEVTIDLFFVEEKKWRRFAFAIIIIRLLMALYEISRK